MRLSLKKNHSRNTIQDMLYASTDHLISQCSLLGREVNHKGWSLAYSFQVNFLVFWKGHFRSVTAPACACTSDPPPQQYVCHAGVTYAWLMRKADLFLRLLKQLSTVLKYMSFSCKYTYIQKNRLFYYSWKINTVWRKNNYEELAVPFKANPEVPCQNGES
jgi:hypothetical protein